MATYKPYALNQAKMIPLSHADQIVEGSFEHALTEILEDHLNLTVCEARYSNDETLVSQTVTAFMSPKA